MSGADDIAARGVKRVRMGDREHEFFDPKALLDYEKEVAADALDDEFGGFLPIETANPS